MSSITHHHVHLDVYLYLHQIYYGLVATYSVKSFGKVSKYRYSSFCLVFLVFLFYFCTLLLFQYLNKAENSGLFLYKANFGMFQIDVDCPIHILVIQTLALRIELVKWDPTPSPDALNGFRAPDLYF